MKSNKKRGFIIIGIGLVIGLLSLFCFDKSVPIEDNRIERNEFGIGEKEVSLVASSDLGDSLLVYSVQERSYSDEELNAMLPEFLSVLEQEVLGKNVSPNEICTDLNFVGELDTYPFEIIWTVSDKEYIDSQGILKKDIKESIQIVLTAEIECDDFMIEHSFPIVLVPQENTLQENWDKKLMEELNLAHERSRENSYFTLPAEINGTPIVWRMEREKKGMVIAAFCLTIGILLVCADGMEKKEQDKKRRLRMSKEYPEFVLKYSMLIGAGLTHRQAFEKMVKAYVNVPGRKKLLYEEMVVGIRELENGRPEREVYERFGKRCGIKEAEKFGNMLSRNLRKGTAGLKSALREEAAQAMQMQKEQIKKQGETAGTRLLFPMLILLLIVMVIIMVPAFSTFSI